MTSSLPPLTQALTGALGSASASALTYPLDLLAARVQTQTPRDVRKTGHGLQGAINLMRRIVRKEGLETLYAGLASDMGATLISNFFYFYAYAWLRNALLRIRSKSKGRQVAALTVPTELALGFIAGIASRALSTPLSVVTVRLQTARARPSGADLERGEKRPASPSDSESDEEEESATVSNVIQRLYAEEGLVGFWRGFSSTIPLCLNPSITFALFQLFRRFTARLSRTSAPAGALAVKPGPLESFFGAALSNSFAVALLYPLILAKVKAQAAHRGPGKAGMKNALDHVLREKDSPLGLYHGLEAQLVKGFMSQGVSFLLKERIEQLLIFAIARKRAHGV